MKKTIYLITSNPWKVESFNNILAQYNLPISIEMLNAEYTENKDLWTTQWVVLDGAKVCAEKYQKPVLVQDSGLFINALNGFPWVNTKFALNRIGNQWIIKLMQWAEDRSCSWNFSLGYCEPGQNPISFDEELLGIVSNTELWSDWFGFDPIFIPQWYDLTFAQDTQIRDQLSPFHNTLKSLINFIS